MNVLRDPLLVPIWVPLVAGILALFIPRKASPFSKLLAASVTLFVATWCVMVWASPQVLGGVSTVGIPPWEIVGRWAKRPAFTADALSAFAAAAAGVLGFIMTLFSIGACRDAEINPRRLYSSILLSVGAIVGCLYSDDMVVVGLFWGFLGIPFYVLLNLTNSKDAAAAAKKAFIIIGGTDALFLVGTALAWLATGGHLAQQVTEKGMEFSGETLNVWFLLRGQLALHGKAVPISTETVLATGAFLCFMAAGLAKAGAMPFHTWLPDVAAAAPAPVVAFLPASLDKILGIYLVARLCLTMFSLSGFLSSLLMALGAVTIVAAVLMALIQHDLKKLLGFHAVSQVGYMLLGIGTGTFVGVAGALFHMLNNAIYKAALFLTASSVERRTGTTEIGELGGLAKSLPISFVTALVAALAISGVPPLNGFVSKWMIYQGVVESGGGGYLWVLLLAAATFGSALTLASFVKVVYGVYLAPAPEGRQERSREGENVLTIIPMALLALACVVFGIAAFVLPLRWGIFPAVEQGLRLAAPETAIGLWRPGVATVLMLIGIAAGVVVYLAGTGFKPRESSTYVGGEVTPDFHFGGPDFYETVARIPPLTAMYRRAAAGFYDVYLWCYESVQYAGRTLSMQHTGVLYRYVTWALIGFVVMIWALLK